MGLRQRPGMRGSGLGDPADGALPESKARLGADGALPRSGRPTARTPAVASSDPQEVRTASLGAVMESARSTLDGFRNIRICHDERRTIGVRSPQIVQRGFCLSPVITRLGRCT